jgi:hypothetical protein
VFRPDPSLPCVTAAREQVMTVVESINQPQISIPGKASQAVRGHLCGVRNANGTFSVFVAFYLPESAENVIYAHEPRELAADAYRAAEAEGLQYLESMGFMLDNLNFRTLPADAQQRALERVPAFSRRAPAAAAPKDAAASPLALARLLASF